MKRSELLSIRDTVQSIWVAIILAFVLRAFMLEAFEIPTGSMAPRLMGKHVLITCSDCKYRFPRELSDRAGGELSGRYRAPCPNCGKVMYVNPDAAKSGDRVLVLKLPRIVRPLERWDVVVFKNVQDNHQNYIKRLIGLPGEAVRIIRGDVYIRTLSDRNDDATLDDKDLQAPLLDATGWRIARKPHRTQSAMWQLLFDNDFQPANRARQQNPFKPLWEVAQPDGGGWRIDVNAGRVFQYEGTEPAELTFARGNKELFLPANAYNSYIQNAPARMTGVPCSDLRLETKLLVTGDSGAMRLTLGGRGHEFAAQVHFDGRVRLLHRPLDRDNEPAESWDQADTWLTVGLPPFRRGRAVPLALTQVDWRVVLWVDGEPVLTTTDQMYRPDVAALLAKTGRDNAPPRVGITGLAGSFQLWHTRVLRDVFYTCPVFVDVERKIGTDGKDYLTENFGEENGIEKPSDWNGKPGWGTRDNPIVLRRFEKRSDYDEFFMLGDNSPSSSDSRLWVEVAPTLRLYDELNAAQYRPGTVPRYNLIGKAFFVYWPAGTPVPALKDIPGVPSLSIIPNVGKMRRIN